MDTEPITFGRFRLDLVPRELRRDGEPLRLYRRALDILCVLATAKGEVAKRDELMARLPDKLSIVVMPFQNLSGDPDGENFADGRSRNSSFTFKGSEPALQEVEIQRALDRPRSDPTAHDLYLRALLELARGSRRIIGWRSTSLAGRSARRIITTQ
jgi:hypothetical protein